MSAERIVSALSALAMARGGTLDEAQGLVYARLLQESDPGLVERACMALAKEPREEFETLLPSVGAILTRAGVIRTSDTKALAASKLLPLPKVENDEPRYFCADCLDEPSGWRIHQCAGWHALIVDERTTKRLEGLDGRHCGKRTQHGPHSFAEKCHCYQHNPVVAQWNQKHTKH